MKEKQCANKNDYYYLISIFFIVITSCDPAVNYNKIIQNDSEYDIKISVLNGNSFYYDQDSFYIEKHSEKSIMEYRSLGQTFEFEECRLFADSLLHQIISNDTFSLALDLNDRSNWDFTIQNETYRSGGTCECRIVLNNEDIE